MLFAQTAPTDVNWMLELGKQTPSLAVLVIVVVIFLRHLDKFDQRREDADKRRDVTMAQVAIAYNRNTEVMGRTSETLDRVERVLEDIRK